MITVEFVLGIIFLTLAVTSLVFTTIIAFSSRNANWFWAWFPCTVLIIIGVAMSLETPRESDVLDGKAHYVEVYHTYNNDTIKTYHINWDKKEGAHR